MEWELSDDSSGNLILTYIKIDINFTNRGSDKFILFIT
jgi:hypothetical protein